MPFQIIRNDITKVSVDAIVNPANPLPKYGAGIDTAIYHAAGRKELLEKRTEIGEMTPGTSAVTPGFKLPAKYIIHTVGTFWADGKSGEEDIIRKCYRSAFDCALECGAESIAFPLLASGSYGFPKDVALKIALSEIHSFLDVNEMDVYLVVFDRKSVLLSGELYGDIDSYIDENYVETVKRREYFGSTPFGRVGRNAAVESSCEAMESVESTESIKFRENKSAARSPRSLEDVIRNLDKTFMELVFDFADAKGINDVQLQKRANLDKRAYSKLKCGTTRKPSQSTALALAIGLELNLDETKDLLSRAGLALSPCSRQDLIVQYFIEREVYDIDEINLALFDHGQPLLGSAMQ